MTVRWNWAMKGGGVSKNLHFRSMLFASVGDNRSKAGMSGGRRGDSDDGLVWDALEYVSVS